MANVHPEDSSSSSDEEARIETEDAPSTRGVLQSLNILRKRFLLEYKFIHELDDMEEYFIRKKAVIQTRITDFFHSN